MDYRDFALTLVEEGYASSFRLLTEALCYMSQDEVKGLLEANDYPTSEEELRDDN